MQCAGITGKAVEWMIRRSVRKQFHTLYWQRPQHEIKAPAIIAANHHSWYDGYVMLHALTALKLEFVDWIEEFDVFPLFEACGGMPFPKDDPARRASTIRKTIRLMTDEKKSLLLFPEGVLHYPDSLLHFGEALEFVASKVPEVQVIPAAIAYEFAMHERAEAFIQFGEPIHTGAGLAARTQAKVAEVLSQTRVNIRENKAEFETLAKGTADINERMNMRKMPKGFRKYQ